MYFQFTGEEKKKFRHDIEKFDADCYMMGKQQFQRGVMLVGPSGTGKTTTMRIINNPQTLFVIGKKKGKHTQFAIANRDPNESARIGLGLSSQTVKPNIAIKIIKDKNIYLIDTPGFFDTKGAGAQLYNRVLIRQLFRSTKELRFVVVINQRQFANNKSNGVQRCFYAFLDCFKQTTPNLHKIIGATSLVVTQSQVQDIQSIKQLLQQMLESTTSKSSILLINHFLKAKKIHFIKMPKAQGNLSPQMLSVGQQIMEYEASQNFYSINQQLDIGFQFKQKKIDSFYTELTSSLKQICSISKQAFLQTIENLTKPQGQKNFTFIQKMEKFIKKDGINVYRTQEKSKKEALSDRKNIIIVDKSAVFNNLKQQFEIFQNNNFSNFSKIQLTQIKLKEEHKDFTEMLFLWNILNAERKFRLKVQSKTKSNQKPDSRANAGSMIQKAWLSMKKRLGKQENQKNQISLLQQVQFLLNAYLNNIFNYSMVKNTDPLIDFIYIASRFLKQIEYLESSKGDVPKQYSEIVEILEIDKTPLIEKEKQFIICYNLQKNENQKYLQTVQQAIAHIHKRQQQAADLIQNQIAPVNEANDKYNKNWSEFQLKRKQLLIQIKRRRGGIHRKNKFLIGAIQQFEKCRQQNEQLYASENAIIYQKVDTDLYRQEAEMWMEQKEYLIAIELFKVIGFQTKISQCFDLMSQLNLSNNAQWINNRIKYAQYHASVTNFEKAAMILADAHDKVKLDDLKLRRSKQKQIRLLKQYYRNDLNQKIEKQKYFNRKHQQEDQERPRQEEIRKLYKEWLSKIHIHRDQGPSRYALSTQEFSSMTSQRNNPDKNVKRKPKRLNN